MDNTGIVLNHTAPKMDGRNLLFHWIFKADLNVVHDEYRDRVEQVTIKLIRILKMSTDKFSKILSEIEQKGHSSFMVTAEFKFRSTEAASATFNYCIIMNRDTNTSTQRGQQPRLYP